MNGIPLAADSGPLQPPGTVIAAEEVVDVQAVCATLRTEFIRLGEQLRVDLGRELRLSLQAAAQASLVTPLDDGSDDSDSEEHEHAHSGLFVGETNGALFTPKNFIHMSLKSRTPEAERSEEQPLKAPSAVSKTHTENETLRQTAGLQADAKSERNPSGADFVVAASTIRQTPLEAFGAEPDSSNESRPAGAHHGEEAIGAPSGTSPDKHNLSDPWGNTAHIYADAETPLEEGNKAQGSAGARKFAMPRVNPHKALGLVPSVTRREPLKRQNSWRVYQCCAQVVCNPYFDWFFLILNFLSAAIIGIETEVIARRLPDDLPKDESFGFFFSDICFLVLFLVESSLRLGVYGQQFFRMSGWGWNLFDLILVTLQFINVVIVRQLMDGPQSLNSTYYPRMVSLLRTLKVGRIMEKVDHFRLLWSCVVHSFPSFLFAFMLVALMKYMMANYIVQAITALRYSDSINAEQWSEISKFYSTVPEAWFSLLLGLTGGVDWNDIVSPLWEGVDPWVAFAVTCLMVFMILSLMNVVTGTFVQNAMEQADEQKQVNKVQRAKRLFDSMDVDSSGTIAFKELSEHLGKKEVQTYFETLDVDPHEAKALFQMLDMNDSGSIDFEEFLSGCIRLQGPAKSMDLLLVARDMRHELKRLTSRLLRLYQVQNAGTIPGMPQERPPGAANEQDEAV